MANIRKPTRKQEETLEQSRELYRKGIEGEQDIMSKFSTTMAKSARDDIRAAKKMRESVPEPAREYEAYQQAGYKKGGKVMKRRYAEGGGVDDEERKALAKNPVSGRLIKYAGKALREGKEAESQKDFATAVKKGVPGGLAYAGSVPAFAAEEALRPAYEKFKKATKQEVEYKKGGKVGSASKRADGCCVRGKTRGRMM